MAIVVVPAMAPDSHQAIVEIDPGRQVLVSLDTPAPDAPASPRSGPPAPGSRWALVTLPAAKDTGSSGSSPSGAGPSGAGPSSAGPAGSGLPAGAWQAIVDHLRGTGDAPGPAGPAPKAQVAAVAGVAEVHTDETEPDDSKPDDSKPADTGSPDAPPATTAAPPAQPTTSVYFTGTAAPPESITVGPSTSPTTAIVTVVTVDYSSPAGTGPTDPPSTEPPTSTTSTPDPPAPDPTPTDPSPADGATAGPVVGARDVRFWPFAANSVWNTPRGADATFDSREIVANGEINAGNGFGVSVGNAGYPLTDQINTNQYAESHYSFVNADGLTATEWYQYQNPGNVNRNNSITDLRGSGIATGIVAGPVGAFNQQRASKVSQLGGLIRAYDLARGVIRHALSVALPNRALKAGWVWPAFGQDGDAATAYQGFVPMGSLIAIPSDATMPAGMSAVGQMIWTALRDYGAYVVDRGATAPIVAEAAAAATVQPARADLARIWPQVRVVTNSGRGAVGGPGPRLAPPAPAVP